MGFHPVFDFDQRDRSLGSSQFAVVFRRWTQRVGRRMSGWGGDQTDNAANDPAREGAGWPAGRPTCAFAGWVVRRVIGLVAAPPAHPTPNPLRPPAENDGELAAS